MKNRSNFTIFTTIFSVLACIGLAYGTGGPDSPDPTGRPVNSNTADGFRALENSDNAFNSAFGWFSLFNNTDAFFSTGLGAGTLFANDGADNTAVGAAAMFFNTTGADNTAVGINALRDNDSGSDNNAVGSFALFSNFDGFFNNAHGHIALTSNVSGGENNAFGDRALRDSTGSFNTAMGDDALLTATGDDNTAFGNDAGNTITTGFNDICIGSGAGSGIVDGNAIIAIGSAATGIFANFGPTTFIGGINEPTGDPGSTVAVLIDSNNNLGTSASSGRFKHDIKPMEKASEALLALKPVSFKYNYDVKGSTQYGLIAEDVAQVNPHLVLYRDGEPYTVKYDQINVMLLNEFLKEHKKVEKQQASISQLKSEMQTMVAQLKEQAAQIQKVSARLEVNKPAAKVVVNKP
jgi:hypothetical protein